MQTTPLSSILLLASPSSVATILFFIIFLTTLVYVLKGEIKKGLDIKDPPTDGQRLFADRDFVLDLKKIIIEEGGIYEFLDKILPLVKNGNWDANNYWSYKSITFAKHIAGQHIPRIIQKILDSPGFKEFAKKEGLRKKDLKAWGNGFYFVLTSFSFRKTFHNALIDVGDDAEFVYRDMTEEEKRKFFNLDHL